MDMTTIAIIVGVLANLASFSFGMLWGQQLANKTVDTWKRADRDDF